MKDREAKSPSELLLVSQSPTILALLKHGGPLYKGGGLICFIYPLRTPPTLWCPYTSTFSRTPLIMLSRGIPVNFAPLSLALESVAKLKTIYTMSRYKGSVLVRWVPGAGAGTSAKQKK